jgi:hypothetical protein
MSLLDACLAEEPQESSNKVFKYSREHFTRKTSRINTNKDLMTRMLCTPWSPAYGGAKQRRSWTELSAYNPVREEKQKCIPGGY